MKPILNRKWPLFILPALYLTLSFIFLNAVKEFHINHIDPSYAYLMNGVNLASGHCRVGIIEHPGTPVECFVALVIFIKHIFSDNTQLYQDVLLHPESYLYSISLILALLLAFTTYMAGNMVYNNSANIGVSILFQLSPLFFSDIIKMTVSLDTESLMTIFGIFFIAYLYVNTIGYNQISGNRTSTKNSIIFGLFTALLTTTKMYCLPIAFVVLFLIKDGKQKVIYIASCCFFSVLLLFPLYNQLKNWAGGIKSMIFHTGFYGHGNTGIINGSAYWNSILDIFTNHIIFSSVFTIVILAFIVTLFTKRREKTGNSDLRIQLMGITIFFTLFLLIIAKQYTFSYSQSLTGDNIIVYKFYYFIPLFICFPLALNLSHKILSSVFNFKSIQFYSQKLLYCILFVFIAFGGYYSLLSCVDIPKTANHDKADQFLKNYKNTPIIKISNGNNCSVEMALAFGISYAGKWDSQNYIDYLKKAYPYSYTYMTWEHQLHFWNEKADLPTIIKTNNRALIYFSDMDTTFYAPILTELGVQQIQKNRGSYRKILETDNGDETIYLLETDTLKHF